MGIGSGPDGIEVALSTAEVAILSRLPALLGSIGSDGDDPAAVRLHPVAYRDDEQSAAELRRLTQDDVAAARNADIEIFQTGLAESGAGVTLRIDEAEAWIRVLGAARIALAARRDLFDVEDLSTVPMDDPDVALVNLLGAYQQALSEALLEEMRGP